MFCRLTDRAQRRVDRWLYDDGNGLDDSEHSLARLAEQTENQGRKLLGLRNTPCR